MPLDSPADRPAASGPGGPPGIQPTTPGDRPAAAAGGPGSAPGARSTPGGGRSVLPEGLSVLPVTGLGGVRPGDDLAALIAGAAPWLADGDVLVVTSKIVSKAEGALAQIPPGVTDRDAARAIVIADETARVVATRGLTHIVQTRHGFVMAAAGVDASNVDPDHLVLLPKDPDSSARILRAELRDRFGLDVVVIISDTMGRPWRNGLTDVALGVAGLDPIRDYRGERDAYGNELYITQMSPVDELCGAAELVKGKADGVPVAVVRGLALTGRPDGPGAAVLVRAADTDMFSLGTAEARADGLRRAARLDDPGLLTQAWPLATVAEIAGQWSDPEATIVAALAQAPSVAWVAVAPMIYQAHLAGDPTIAAAVRAGAEIHAVRCALAGAGHRTTWAPRLGDAPAPHAPGPHTPGSHLPDSDALGWDAPGSDAPGLDAPGSDAPGSDAAASPGTAGGLGVLEIHPRSMP